VINMSDNIAGKVVVITGASAGIGAETARHLAGLGAKVVLGARRENRLRDLAAEIANAGGEAVYRVTDVARRDQVEALVALGIDSFGRVDVLINNAGTMLLSRLARLKVDEWERMIDVNVKGVLYGIGAVLPHFRERDSGHVINLSSVAGHVVFPTGAVYCATKHAVRVISDAFRKEAGPNVRSTIISPGQVDTELPEHSPDERVREKMREAYKNAISPHAIAEAIAFAIAQPTTVDVNEILVRPTAQER
jgi:NADP-dependent 3-hydroxy acid dehydrogenase YdfG